MEPRSRRTTHALTWVAGEGANEGLQVYLAVIGDGEVVTQLNGKAACVCKHRRTLYEMAGHTQCITHSQSGDGRLNLHPDSQLTELNPTAELNLTAAMRGMQAALKASGHVHGMLCCT